MNITVSIIMVDEFNQKMTGYSESLNLDYEAHNQVDLLFQHVKQAVLALGFTQDQINEYMK